MAASRDHLLVKIVAEKPIHWSTNNGLTMTEYVPGKVYKVPDYVAWGMEKRKEAKVISEDEVEVQDTVDTTVDVKALRQAKPKQEEKPT